jgi:transcription factor WhiB
MDSDDVLEQAIAMAVCRSRPVRDRCLGEGRDEPGVWGATTEQQRRQLGQQVA